MALLDFSIGGGLQGSLFGRPERQYIGTATAPPENVTPSVRTTRDLNRSALELDPRFSALDKLLRSQIKSSIIRNEQNVQDSIGQLQGAETRGGSALTRGQHEALQQINQGRNNIESAFQRAFRSINETNPINPISDQMREDALAQIRDGIARETQQNLRQARLLSASRGVLNSGQAVDAESQIRQEALRNRVQADIQTRQEQNILNIEANQERSRQFNNLINQYATITGGLAQTAAGIPTNLAGLAANNITRLGGLAGQIGTINQIDPTLLSSVTSNIFGTQLAEEDRARLLEFAKENAQRQDTLGILEFLGQGIASAFPNNPIAQIGGGAIPAAGSFFLPRFSFT